jgi:hypothetical protein
MATDHVCPADPYNHLDASIHAVQQQFPGPVAEALEEARGILQAADRDAKYPPIECPQHGNPLHGPPPGTGTTIGRRP